MERETEKQDKKNGEKKQNWWRPRWGRTNQTNEAVKKCETSAVPSARQCNMVQKRNGCRVEEEEEEEEGGNLSLSRQRVMSRA